MADYARSSENPKVRGAGYYGRRAPMTQEPTLTLSIEAADSLLELIEHELDTETHKQANMTSQARRMHTHVRDTRSKWIHMTHAAYLDYMRDAAAVVKRMMARGVSVDGAVAIDNVTQKEIDTAWWWSIFDLDHSLYHEIWKFRTQLYHRLKPNPPKSVKVEQHYDEFHGTEPGKITNKTLWVPGPVVLLGQGVDIGYGVTDRNSSKAGRYVHDFESGVKIYRRAKDGEHASKIYKRFPTDLMVLGDFLGLTYKEPDGNAEVKGNTRIRLASTPDRKTLVVLHMTKGVLFVCSGGRMLISDWIYR